jgi:ABC-type transport system involved in multi-copper enzyme maturation permease subunit
MRLRPVSLLGPLFYEELARLGRRGANFTLRAGLVLALLGATFLLYPQNETLRFKEQAEFSQRLFLSFVGIQFAALWFLTPLLAAGVLTEERERKILDVLLTTTLTAREIACGKLLARITFLGGVLLAGLPVLALLRVFGGVALDALVLAYIGLFAHLFGAAGLCAGIAASARSYRVALYSSWGLLFLGQFCPVFGPVAGIGMIAGEDKIQWWLVALFVAVNIGVGLCGMIVCTYAVRPWEAQPLERTRVAETRPVRRRSKDADEKLPVARPVARPTYRRIETAKSKTGKAEGLRADVNWLWPAGEANGPSDWQIVGFFAVAASAIAFPARLAAIDRLPDSASWPVMSVFAWLPAAMLTAVQTSGTISREREADTLTMLLTVPPDRMEILWRKVLRAGSRHLWAYAIAAGGGALSFLTSSDWYWYPAKAPGWCCSPRASAPG